MQKKSKEVWKEEAIKKEALKEEEGLKEEEISKFNSSVVFLLIEVRTFNMITSTALEWVLFFFTTNREYQKCPIRV